MPFLTAARSAPSPLRVVLLAGFLTAALRVGPVRAASADTNPLEYAVKASYLYKFAPFVEWPPQAFATASSPLTICIAGDDPFGSILDEVTRGQQLETHPIVVRRMATVEPGAPCHILYLGRSTAQSQAQMLKAVDGRPVLTVSELGHGDPGGVIQFVLRDGRVRFDIDPAAATANGVTISSKLLDLAISQRKRSESDSP